MNTSKAENLNTINTCLTPESEGALRRKPLASMVLGASPNGLNTLNASREKSFRGNREREKNSKQIPPPVLGVKGVTGGEEPSCDYIPDHWKIPQPQDPPLMANGWSRPAWADRLDYLATACEKLNPKRSEELRRMATETRDGSRVCVHRRWAE